MKILIFIMASVAAAAIVALVAFVGGWAAEALLPGERGEAAAIAIYTLAFLLTAGAISLMALNEMLRAWLGFGLFPGFLEDDS